MIKLTQFNALIAILIVSILFGPGLFACTQKPDTDPTPAKLTPEQRLALAKVAGLGAVALLDSRIRAAENAGQSEKARALMIARSALEEYNRQIAPIESFNVNDRQQLRRAGIKALESAERIIHDAQGIGNPETKAALLDAIAIARVVIQSVQAIIPAD